MAGIVVTGRTTSSPYEIDFAIGKTFYIYGADYGLIQKCLFISRKSVWKALNYIQKRADYCLKFKVE